MLRFGLFFKKSMCQNSDNDNKNLYVIVDYPSYETRHHSCSKHKKTLIKCGDVYLMHCFLLIHTFSSTALLISNICDMYILNSHSSMKNMFIQIPD